MLVQLKQQEIVAALTQYIASQGINLQAKQVDVAFTAGRGTTGISAVITIEDSEDIPDFGELPQEQRPALTVVATEPVAQELAVLAVEGQAVAEEAVEDAPKPKTSSLFG